MADDAPKAQPVALRIKVRFADVDAFVERFAPYVGRAGLFLRHKQPKPVGTEVKFELRLIDDRPVLVGMGVVRWAREPDVDRPQRPPGMAIEFTRVTKESREVILRVLELRRKLGMKDGPRGLPDPPDDDSVPNTAATASAIAADVSGPVAAPPPAPEPAPEPVPEPRVIEPLSSPVALEAHTPRRRAPAPADLIAAATAGGSAPTGDAFDATDVENADVAGVLARARALAGADADKELEALLEAAAAPIEITIQEASAGLASLFGTAPIPVRHRSRADDSVPVAAKQGYATPPPVAAAAVADVASKIEASFLGVLDEETPTPVQVPHPTPKARATDVETTKVVNLEALAAATVAPEPQTRVVSLESLAQATAQRDPDERTAVFSIQAEAGVDDERTKVVRINTPPPARDDVDDTLDFDSDRRVPREFEENDRDVDTQVRAKPPAPTTTRKRPSDPPPLPPPRATRRTTPPPPPPRRGSAPTITSASPHAEPGVTSSGSIDITDIVAELEAESAQPVRRTTEDGVGERLHGEALDAEGLLATGLDKYRVRRPPDGPVPDLASFADPPAAPHRPSPRADSLDAALDALAELDLDGAGPDPDADGEERTSYDRPSSHSGNSRITPAPEKPPSDDDEDDGLEIEISLDDE